jgi:hypothetical protein
VAILPSDLIVASTINDGKLHFLRVRDPEDFPRANAWGDSDPSLQQGWF